MRRKIELLSPAKNLECGLAAVNCGADAVYIGASAFGARAAAGNSLPDIEKLVRYAHLFRVKVFVTLNTILNDSELRDAEQLIHDLYNMGVDALITQDVGLLQLDLPPIALHASTQMDNRTVEKVSFLENVGFQRVVLARELSLTQIEEIHRQTGVELEAFVHGALCVSYSGQCYMSQAGCGRSANRGNCAQFCRLPYSLVDENGKTLLENRHLLSLMDMNRSDYLLDMMKCGVTSFKIEGRLKEVDYVKNVTAFYRGKLDAIFDEYPDFESSSFGTSRIDFEPNPEKSFYRGKTTCFLTGDREKMARFATPKSVGEEMGPVAKVFPDRFVLKSKKELHNGDGLCFFDENDSFSGFRVNRSENNVVFPAEMPRNLKAGVVLYRNQDALFQKLIRQNCAERRLALDISFSETESGFEICLHDETGDEIDYKVLADKVLANNAEQANALLQTQFSKLGNTVFSLRNFSDSTKRTYFFPASVVADWRRKCVELLMDKKDAYRPKDSRRTDFLPEYPAEELDYRANVFNEKAREFYKQHGVVAVADAFEKQPQSGVEVMRCKYCLRFELGMCLKKSETGTKAKRLFLVSQNQRFQLSFDCSRCEMSVLKK